MDNDHNLIITPKGQYQYNPDLDHYVPVPEANEQTHLAQFGWIYVCAVLTVVGYCVTLV